MGHVPAGPVPAEGEGDDVSRRQHRGAGADSPVLRRDQVARRGEDIAAHFLSTRGNRVLYRNVSRGRDEIDLIAQDPAGERFAVEVKTRWGSQDPREGFDARKERAVRAAATALGLGRVDLVSVRMHAGGVEIRWQRRV